MKIIKLSMKSSRNHILSTSTKKEPDQYNHMLVRLFALMPIIIR